MKNKKNGIRENATLSTRETLFSKNTNSITNIKEIVNYQPKAPEDALYCMICLLEAAYNNRRPKHGVYFSIADWEIRVSKTVFTKYDLVQIIAWLTRFNLRIEIKRSKSGKSYPLLCKESIDPVQISSRKYLTAIQIANALLLLAGRIDLTGLPDFNPDKLEAVAYLVKTFNVRRLGVLDLFNLQSGPQLTGELGEWV